MDRATRAGETLSEKLKEKERADENVFFARRDDELVAQLRAATNEAARRRILERAHLRCPDCGAGLVRATHHGVAIEECPDGHGLWLTAAELRTLARRERNSWIGRYFYRPRLGA
jgi:uncharacterized protein with PIN domain